MYEKQLRIRVPTDRFALSNPKFTLLLRPQTTWSLNIVEILNPFKEGTLYPSPSGTLISIWRAFFGSDGFGADASAGGKTKEMGERRELSESSSSSGLLFLEGVEVGVNFEKDKTPLLIYPKISATIDLSSAFSFLKILICSC
jgi:hypothetical protein